MTSHGRIPVSNRPRGSRWHIRPEIAELDDCHENRIGVRGRILFQVQEQRNVSKSVADTAALTLYPEFLVVVFLGCVLRIVLDLVRQGGSDLAGRRSLVGKEFNLVRI